MDCFEVVIYKISIFNNFPIEKYILNKSENSTLQLSILTSTKNTSLIITDFLAMIYKNEQSRTASLCRGWAMLENDFNLIYR